MSACSSSHSETNPLPGGSADAPSAPIPKQHGGGRHTPGQAAHLVQVAQAGAAQHRPRAQEQHGLERRVVQRRAATRRSSAGRPAAHHPPRRTPRAAHPDEDQAHVLGGGVGQQPLEVGRGDRPAGCRRAPTPHRRRAPAATTSAGHRRAGRSRPAASPYTPRLTIAADIRADTWLGASGCARGSQTCSGTRPAFDPNPASASTNTSRPACSATARWRRPGSPAKDSSPAAPASSTRLEQDRDETRHGSSRRTRRPAPPHLRAARGARRAPAPARPAPSAPTAPGTWSRSRPPEPASGRPRTAGRAAWTVFAPSLPTRVRPAVGIRRCRRRSRSTTPPDTVMKTPTSGSTANIGLAQRQQVPGSPRPCHPRPGHPTPATSAAQADQAGQRCRRPGAPPRPTADAAATGRDPAAPQATSARPVPTRLIDRSAAAAPR